MGGDIIFATGAGSIVRGARRLGTGVIEDARSLGQGNRFILTVAGPAFSLAASPVHALLAAGAPGEVAKGQTDSVSWQTVESWPLLAVAAKSLQTRSREGFLAALGLIARRNIFWIAAGTRRVHIWTVWSSRTGAIKDASTFRKQGCLCLAETTPLFSF